jgi:hypothetical protein
VVGGRTTNVSVFLSTTSEKQGQLTVNTGLAANQGTRASVEGMQCTQATGGRNKKKTLRQWLHRKALI